MICDLGLGHWIWLWQAVWSFFTLSDVFSSDLIIDISVQHEDYCTVASMKLFTTAMELGTHWIFLFWLLYSLNSPGYEIFSPQLPLRKVPGCANKHYTADLLLIHQEFLDHWLLRENRTLPGLDSPYQIMLFHGDSFETDNGTTIY